MPLHREPRRDEAQRVTQFVHERRCLGLHAFIPYVGPKRAQRDHEIAAAASAAIGNT